MIKCSERFSLKRHLVNDYYIKFFLKERLDEFIFNFPLHAIVIVNFFFKIKRLMIQILEISDFTVFTEIGNSTELI